LALDSSGHVIGPLISFGWPNGSYRVFFPAVQAVGLLQATNGLFTEDRIFFSQEGCVGQAFVEDDYAGRIVAHGWTADQRLFFGENTLGTDLQMRSKLGSPCDPFGPGTYSVVPATEITRTDLGLPATLTLPIAIDLSP
jgi:hypothetical protein